MKTPQIIIGAFALVFGDIFRLIYGVDSFGNVCNRHNRPLTNVTNSGRDLSQRPYVAALSECGT